MKRLPINENIFIGGDFNGHVGNSRSGFENVYGGFGFWGRNEVGTQYYTFSSLMT